jgi:hypothetical protein
MRRGISVAMVIFGLPTVLTGIWQFFPPFNDMFYMPHVTTACIFGLLVGIHIWLNRKPIVRYFKGLGWQWILIGLGVVYIIWIGIAMPILLMGGWWNA